MAFDIHEVEEARAKGEAVDHVDGHPLRRQGGGDGVAHTKWI
jgi:hypothetical protein